MLTTFDIIIDIRKFFSKILRWVVSWKVETKAVEMICRMLFEVKEFMVGFVLVTLALKWSEEDALDCVIMSQIHSFIFIWVYSALNSEFETNIRTSFTPLYKASVHGGVEYKGENQPLRGRSHISTLQ